MIIVLVSLFTVCGKGDSSKTKNKLTAAVSILPQKYFLERIGGDRVNVIVLVGAGQSPHSYDPTPVQMSALSMADIWILSDTDFEIGLKPRIASQYPSLKIIDGTQGVKFRLLEDHHHDGDIDDEHSKENHSTNIDRHTWLGREPVKIMSGHIFSVLVEKDPAGREYYEANYKALITDIDTAFDNLKIKLAPLSGRSVLVFHPAFGYFLDEFGIEQVAVETGGKEPTAKDLIAIINQAKAVNTHAIFVQMQFPVTAAKTVADSVGAKVIMLDPLSDNWLVNINIMGDVLGKDLTSK